MKKLKSFNPEIGFIYVCKGKNYIKEACLSIRTLRIFHSNPIRIFTDEESLEDNTYSVLNSLKVDIKKIANLNPSDLFKYYLDSPFRYTLALETDTFIQLKIDSVFKLLNRFDICYANNPSRSTELHVNQIPSSLALPDTGVIGFRLNKEMKMFFKLCHSLMKKSNYKFTPGEALMEAVWNSNNIRPYTLPEEFCARSKNVYNLGFSSKLNKFNYLKPKIHHMRLFSNFQNNNLHGKSIELHLKECSEISMLELTRVFLKDLENKVN